MYDGAEKEIDRIVELVGRCPASLQEKCFEVLLSGYVQSQVAPSRHYRDDGGGAGTAESKHDEGIKDRHPKGSTVDIPQEIRGRFNNTAKRIGVDSDGFASLFDFATDPFTYHALEVPGSGKAEKARNVGLLVAAKNYLVTGHWVGDWKEFRAMCVDQNCYDRTNNPKIMKHQYFKAASAEAGIALSASGQKAAETLLASLARPEG